MPPLLRIRWPNHFDSLHKQKTFPVFLVYESHSLLSPPAPEIGTSFLLRKEVIQPHLPIRLPCYDFTPIICPTLDGFLLAVRSPASGAPNSGGVTGGVYKARERIHRSLADLRLLAIPASCSRVADYNPNWDRLLRIRQLSLASCLLCRPL